MWQIRSVLLGVVAVVVDTVDLAAVEQVVVAVPDNGIVAAAVVAGILAVAVVDN